MAGKGRWILNDLRYGCIDLWVCRSERVIFRDSQFFRLSSAFRREDHDRVRWGEDKHSLQKGPYLLTNHCGVIRGNYQKFRNDINISLTTL